MNFELSDDYKAIQETARNFAEKELLPGVIDRDEKSEFSTDLFKKMCRLGFIGLPYPEEFGGQGRDYLSYALAVEEISKVDGSMGICFSVDTSLYGGSIINSMASDEVKKKFLYKVLTGEAIGSFGLTEPNAGSDAGGIQTTARKEGDYYVLNGSKCFNTNGPVASFTAVYALTEPELKSKGLSCFVVEKGTPGFTVGKIENKMGIRAAQVSELHFNECKIPAENRIAVTGKGFPLALKTLDGGRIGVAAQGLGIAKGAFNIAKEYLKVREQFGKPLFKNQYLAFKMAELDTEIEAAQYILYKAAMDKDNHRPYSVPAAKAKMICTDCAMHVTTECVQMLGGNGYMREYHLERMMRDSKITQIYEGTNEIQKLVISSAMFRNK
ncbi:MAG: acyl-CoA dehydrogenase family protein [Oscillospiraceae bacterium]|nr:acyl-CoA dehydrogenase family protein [Oscillospiraceae bacterium]